MIVMYIFITLLRLLLLFAKNYDVHYQVSFVAFVLF